MRLILLIQILITLFNFAIAQSISHNFNNSAGNNISAGKIEFSYSIGQPFIFEQSNKNISLVNETFASNKIFIKKVDKLSEIRNMDISIYPNPSSEKINLNLKAFSNNYSNFKIEIIDIFGATKYSKTTYKVISGDNIYTFDISNLKKGHYFVRLSSELKNILTFKIMII